MEFVLSSHIAICYKGNEPTNQQKVLDINLVSSDLIQMITD